MSGITRIQITQETNYLKSRVAISRAHEPVLNELYRSIFPTLQSGDEILTVDKQDTKARYDFQEGIDLILTTSDGLRLTVQEKLLTQSFRTVTFEERKGSGAPGGWYYGTSQLYMVAYNIFYPDSIEVQSWMLMDFAALKVADITQTLPWKHRNNKNDGRTEDFRYLNFQDVPESCIVAQHIVQPDYSDFLPF